MATGGETSSSTESANQPRKLDERKESLSLLSILRAYNRPVTEYQAWAILYQSAKTALQCFNSANPPPPPRTTSRHNNNDIQSHQQHANNNIHNLTDKSENEVMKCYVAENPSHIRIHRDGHVLPHSFQLAADSIEADEWRTVAEHESQLVEGLGLTIYGALVYGLAGKLPNISSDLRQIFYSLPSADEGSDEGSDEGEGLSLDEGQSLGLNGDFGEAEDSAAADAAASVFSTSMTSSSSASAASAMTSLTHVMDRCHIHISSTASSDQADAHFRDICRKLVAKTLVKISSAQQSETHSHELTDLHLNDSHDSKELKRTGYLLLDNRTDGQQYIHVQELLAVREERLKARERQIADIQKEEESRLKEELERVREELRVQKELNEQLQEACDVMAKELECRICTQLMVFATSLNCMHTFCQHCIGKWKKQKVECPICRAPITTEGRSLLGDNMIDAMVSSLSEETKNSRKKIVIQRQELMKQASIEQNNT